MLWQPSPGSRSWTTAAGVLVWLVALPAVYAQANLAPAIPGGQGELSFQGYYLGGNQQNLLDTTGAAMRFQQFLPKAGLLSGSFEGYGSQSRFQTGENFLELRGLPWGAQYWTITGGDFRMPATLLELPFNNVFTPEIAARGVEIQVAHGDTRYTVFGGEEMVTAGPRVAYRIASPQRVFGAWAVKRVAAHLTVAARWMQFSSSAQAIAGDPYLFPRGRAAPLARTLAAQVLYTPLARLKVYAECSRPIEGADRPLTSFFAGASWESTMLALKANYVSEGVFYFPLAGYFSGDRRGPFGEARLRPWKRLELYASASRYGNNLEGDTSLAVLTSENLSAGFSAQLPGRLAVNGQVSAVRYTDHEPLQERVTSQNRQTTASLARSFGRQSVQLGWREIRLDTPGAQRQRSIELSDTYQFRRFSVGGAARYQQTRGPAELNSLFFRGLAQVTLGRVVAYANVEIGNDLANQTVFATEAYRTSVVGASVRLPGRWTFQAETFRNQLNFTLNEENAFLLQNGAGFGTISPAAANLTGFGQWSLFFRLSKQLRWGGEVPGERGDRAGAVSAVRLTGSVEGWVRLKTLAGITGAAAVRIVLDGARTAVSGTDGRYVFDKVPEGAHAVGIAMEELPADLDPGQLQQIQVTVQPRRAARADFDVLPLTAVAGRVTGPGTAALEGIVIRMKPGNRYTRTRKDGSFTFYNVREGDYEVMVDSGTLPEGAEAPSPGSAVGAVRIGGPAPALEFRFTVKSTSKPIRRVLEQ